MFNFVGSAISAYNQVGLFAGALICLGIGGLILGNSLYWRLHALRVTGTVVGVLAQGNAYFPVYRYIGPDGGSHDAKSNTGSNTASGKSTGSAVPILVSAHDPGEARESNNHLLGVIGFVVLVLGLWLGYVAATAFPVTPMTWIAGAGFMIYAGERLYRIIKSVQTRLSHEQWGQHYSTIDLTKVQPVETIAASAGLPSQRSKSAVTPKFLVRLLAILVIGLTAAGSYKVLTVYRLETLGMSAEGEIVRLVESSGTGNSGPSYYPVVKFTTADNKALEFRDEIGSNPPSHRIGDKVRVLYLATNPRESIIDRGLLMNWAIPAILLLTAAIAAWFAIKISRYRPALAVGR